MATYAVGDIQGCAQSFAQLLKKIAFHPSRDRLWPAGDLVNRGPASLEVLLQLRALGGAAEVVLGNHDLHAMGVLLGVVRPGPNDTLEELAASGHAAELCAWLRQQPLVRRWGRWGLVHAGLLPMWSAQDVVNLAASAQARLAGDEGCAKAFLAELQQPWRGAWRPGAKRAEQDLVATKMMTYLRACDLQGVPQLHVKGPPTALPKGLLPWHACPQRQHADVTWICGHWSAQGLFLRNNIRALDTGCVWGRQLTALRLDDDTLHSVAACEPHPPRASAEA